MNYLEIQKAMSDESMFDALLAEYQTCFDEVDAASQLLRSNVMNTEADLTGMIMKLTGIYGSLLPVYNIAVATKLNNEAGFFVQKKLEIENAGQKAVIGSIERDVQVMIAPWRNLRAVFESYTQICEKAITSCQSILRKFTKEEMFSGQVQS